MDIYSPLFRLLVYIVAVLSFAPTTIFLSYALFVLFIATCTFTTMWILTVSAFITIGCVVLIPILMAATFTAVGVVACCGVWVRLRNFYKAMKAPSADNKAL
ncbi:uncharacterized protein BYT42DRAFT_564940 [Radiomyces spectabilis]|uniref:uncharacterized protein n=1 Tax=Radiomyces spectabilis TaxID=64574 RepID=UPI00221FD4A0|nr:uncharacterized protein BYT42DRAFT_564940 [Radiomyces spectabilis]KAI8381015.1 hypothetical protein BYT42DRAFT_564940 [Radiomyces spectabilis]